MKLKLTICCLLFLFLACNKLKTKELKQFNCELIKPKSGEINSVIIEKEKTSEISIDLNSFILENKNIHTSIKLDFIKLKVNSVDELQNKTFNFPINPNEGYIDGSIYLLNVHNPFDVTKIIFGKISNSTIETTLYYNIDFEYENTGYEKVENCKLTTNLMLKNK